MKKLLITTALILSLSVQAFAQQEIEACYNFLHAQDYERAIQVGEIAVKKYPNNVLAHLCLGRAYLRAGELKLALSSLMQAEKLTQDKEELLSVYNFIGRAHSSIGNLDDALFYYSRALNLAKDLEMKKYEALLLHNIAEIYYRKGDYDKALRYYEESLNLEEDEKEKAVAYNNIALVHCAQGDYEKALEYFFNALDIGERYGDYHRTATTMLNIGDTFRETKDYKKAEQYLFEGLNRIKRVGDKYLEGIGYKYLGWLYRDLENKQKAVEYFTLAYNIFKSIGAEGNMQEVREALLKLGVDPEKTAKEKKKEKK